MKFLIKQKRVMVSMLVVSLVLSLAACGNSAKNEIGTSTAGTASESTEPITTETVTLTVFGGSSMLTSGGPQNDPISKQIEKETGVILDNVPGDKEKLKILAAGGDLPDIIFMHESPDLCKNLIQSKSVMALDDLLDKYGANIKAAIPTALKASKLVITPTKDKTYFIPTNVQKADPNNPKQNGFVGFFTRWDIYKAVGAPEIKNDEDFLNVMKKMVDHQPKTKAGKKVYALSGWNDWGLWPYLISYPFAHGYTNGEGTSLNCETLELENNYIKEDSIVWQTLKFFNKANQLGIFDPEAFTMKNAQYDSKVKTGQVLVSAASWNMPDRSVVGEEAAMYMIPGTNQYISQLYPQDNLLGYMGANSLAISATCKYPDRAMQVLDYCNSDEGSRWVWNGAKGVDWDVQNGKPVLLGKLLENILSAGAKEADYVKAGNVNGIGRYEFLVVQDQNNPVSDGDPIRISNSIDYKIKTAQAVDKDFSNKYGGTDAVYPGQAYAKMLKDGLVKVVPTSYPLAGSLIGNKSDETKRILATVDQYMNANIAKIILAKNDSEFEVIKKKIIEDIKGMGMEKAQAEIDSLYAEAKKIAEEITK